MTCGFSWMEYLHETSIGCADLIVARRRYKGILSYINPSIFKPTFDISETHFVNSRYLFKLDGRKHHLCNDLRAFVTSAGIRQPPGFDSAGSYDRSHLRSILLDGPNLLSSVALPKCGIARTTPPCLIFRHSC